MLTSKLPRHRIWTRLSLTWLVFLVFLTAYWLHLDASHQEQMTEAELRAQLRGNQAAHALSM